MCQSLTGWLLGPVSDPFRTGSFFEPCDLLLFGFWGCISCWFFLRTWSSHRWPAIEMTVANLMTDTYFFLVLHAPPFPICWRHSLTKHRLDRLEKTVQASSDSTVVLLCSARQNVDNGVLVKPKQCQNSGSVVSWWNPELVHNRLELFPSPVSGLFYCL